MDKRDGAMLEVRLEGFTLRREREALDRILWSKLGLRVEIDKTPQFEMIPVEGPLAGRLDCSRTIAQILWDRSA